MTINKIKTKGILLMLVSFVFVFSAKAQSFYAQVSSNRVQVGVPFEFALVLTVSGSNLIQPSFKDFDIVSGPNQSNSVQYTNGVMTQQIVISYGLVARKEGKLVIGAASVTSNGQKLETKPITMEVGKGAGTSQNSGNEEDPKYSSKISGGDVFIRTGVSKTKCYYGEQILITQKVYSRFSIVGFKKINTPSYDGFYSQTLEPISKGQVSNENVDGVVYQTYEIFRTLATANKAGKITLSPMSAEVVVRKQTANAKPKNIFEQFFGASNYEDIAVNAKSNPLTIDVTDIPEAGKPANYFGAVGEYSYKVQASRNEVRANDAFNLKLTITGKGNIKLVDAPKLKMPESFEMYDPKITESGNSKTFDYLIIPRNEGDFKLDNLDFSYFSLDSKKYNTIPAPEINIKVLPPDPNSKCAQVYVQQSQVKETENDIRYIKKGDFVLMKSETEFFNSTVHILLLILSVLILGTGLFLRRNYIKNNSNMVLVKERKAAKLAKKQLVNAEKLMQQNKKDEFYTEILTALNNYIGNKLNIPVADLSREKITSVLTSKQVDPQSITKLVSTLETSEYAKYAPGAVSGDLQQVYKDTVDLITGLEEQINKKV